MCLEILSLIHSGSPLCSPRRHAAGQPGGLPGLVLRGRGPRRGLWSVHPLVPALHAVLLRVLVQAAVRRLQVRLGRGPEELALLSVADAPLFFFFFSFSAGATAPSASSSSSSSTSASSAST